jgi:hypothetical protein
MQRLGHLPPILKEKKHLILQVCVVFAHPEQVLGIASHFTSLWSYLQIHDVQTPMYLTLKK